jgi:hypothetical protein
MERSVLGVKRRDKIRNSVVRAGTRDILETVVRYAGHLARMGKENY